MTPAEALAKPVTMPWWPDAAPAFGYGRDAAYRAAKDGTAPVPILRLGRRLVVTRAALLHVLGLSENDAARVTTPGPVTTSTPITNGDTRDGTGLAA